jgi:hypothetical protein
VRLTNATALDAETIRDIVRFVCPPGVTGYDLEVTDTRPSAGRRCPYNGRAWCGRSWRVLARVGPAKLFPMAPQPPRRSNYLPGPYIADRTEALVFILAHELRHLWQARIPRGRRVWGARGQYSERDADAYAIKMLRAWRREQ